MQVLQAVITGAIQGLSEFLPISSSAHIVFSNELYNLITNTNVINQQEEIFFDIIVHIATLGAVIIYFFNDLKTIFSGFVKNIKQKNYKDDNVLIVGYIALSTIITGLIGILIKDYVEALITSPKIICFFLIGTGLILLISEMFYKGNKKINLKKSILIAIAQGFAVCPGFSRSGLTIAAGLFQGVERVSAARFSFLMSIPVIFLAGLIYPLLELDLSDFTQFNFKAIIIGAFASFITGYLCIKYFMKLLGKISLRIFGYYCLFAALFLFLLLQVVYHQ